MAEENSNEHDTGGMLESSDPLEQKIAVEETNDHDLGGIPENSSPSEIRGYGNDSGGDGTNGLDLGGIPENSSPSEIRGSGNDYESDGKKWPGWPGDNVFRMLVPVQKVGGIIGRKGELIKGICEETKARIKILDCAPGTTERAVMVSAKEEPDVAIPPAIDGLLRVHKRMVDLDSDSAHAPPSGGGTVCTRLLVAAAQGGSLIGKQGSTIKSIQDASSCIIRVLGGENLPPFALPEDSVVEVQGEPVGVHRAIELIASHLRRFLVDRGVIPMFEMQMQMPDPRRNQNVPPRPTWGPHQSFPINTGGGPGFAPDLRYMQPRQFENYYPPADMPPLDKQAFQGPHTYARDTSMGVHTSNGPSQQSVVTKVTATMQIPISYADTVIGTSGACISYIRRASGASIAIQETRGVPGEMTVEINGSASQVQTAQQLIQNCIAEAASVTPPTVPNGQEYNYPSHGTVYASPVTNTGGHAGYAPGADFGSVYGSYGY